MRSRERLFDQMFLEHFRHGVSEMTWRQRAGQAAELGVHAWKQGGEHGIIDS